MTRLPVQPEVPVALADGVRVWVGVPVAVAVVVLVAEAVALCMVVLEGVRVFSGALVLLADVAGCVGSEVAEGSSVGTSDTNGCLVGTEVWVAGGCTVADTCTVAAVAATAVGTALCTGSLVGEAVST